MGKLQSLIDNKAKSAQYMCDEIKHICNDMPKRDPGSIGEKMACEYMADVLKNDCGCERADVESFKENPNAFFGWIYFTITLVLSGMVLFFFMPIVGAVLTALGFVILFAQFGLYKKVVDKFFPEKTGHSVTAIKKCTGEVKGRVFFNGHPDAVWNWPVNNKFGGKAHVAHLVTSVVSGLVVLALNVAAAVKTGCRPVTDYTLAGYTALYTPVLFWMGIAILVMVPCLVGMYFMWDENTITDGANDNLTGCYMGIAILKAMKDRRIELEHAEVGVIISGSEEAGLRGAMAWCDAHKGEFDDVPTWIYSYDTIHESRFLGVNYRDLNGTVKSDKEVSDSFMTAAQQLGIKCTKTWVPPFGGATDNAAFNKAGFRSTGITALDHNLQDYYHTMRDTADNLNPECLADCYAISVRCLETFDREIAK